MSQTVRSGNCVGRGTGPTIAPSLTHVCKLVVQISSDRKCVDLKSAILLKSQVRRVIGKLDKKIVP